MDRTRSIVRSLFNILVCIVWISTWSVSQDTFSIVAADTTTGEIGSAGATCLDDRSFPGSGGAIIISDVQPGIGALHTQSFYVAGNQGNGRERMLLGEDAEDIIEWLVDNDVQGSPQTRQYGAVTLDTTGSAKAYAFTGAQCFDAKAHIIGPNYAIQGNILINEDVLDSMEANFIRSSGPLCDRLMAALQGANIPGADRRCLNEGVSSQSAFIRVAKPDDDPDDLWMDLNVPLTDFGVEPIDELQIKFDEFKSTLSNEDLEDIRVHIYPVPATDRLWISGLSKDHLPVTAEILGLNGAVFVVNTITAVSASIDLSNIPDGQYLVRVSSQKGGIVFSSKVQIIK
jgi:uncharacterized Ntn-hydrolase superfamily protein